MSDGLSDLRKKETLQNSNAPALSVDKEDNIVFEETPDNVIEYPENFVNVPDYVTRDVSLGQLAEPFIMRKNDNVLESKWVLEINLDHRYIVKY